MERDAAFFRHKAAECRRLAETARQDGVRGMAEDFEDEARLLEADEATRRNEG